MGDALLWLAILALTAFKLALLFWYLPILRRSVHDLTLRLMDGRKRDAP